MTRQGARTAFGPEALAADLGLDEWELISLLRASGRRNAATRRLFAGVAAFIQQLRVAGLTTAEIGWCWHLPVDEVEAMLALDSTLDHMRADGLPPLGDVEVAPGAAQTVVDTLGSWPWPDSTGDVEEVWSQYCVDAIASAQGLSRERLLQFLSRSDRQPDVLRLKEIRDFAFVRLRAAGIALDEIGQEFGVTRETVRQIVIKRGGPTNQQIAEARRRSAERSRRIDGDAAMAVLAEGDILTIHELADALDWSEERVRASLPTRVRSLLSNSKPVATNRSEWSRDDVTAILQAAAEIQEVADESDTPLTGELYDSVKDDLGGPSRATIAKTFGSWNEALAAAGLPFRKGKPKHSKYTDERLWEYIVRYVSDPTVDTITFQGFDEWRTVHEPSAPSAQYIRNRLGPWSRIRLEALGRAKEKALGVGPSDASLEPGDLSEYEYWAAEETLNRVRAGGANPADSFDYDRYAIEGAPSASALRATFGSWGSALGALGWDPEEFVTRRVLVSDEDSIDQLREYVRARLEGSGQVPSANDWEAERDKTNTVGPWSYVRRFGSWREALSAAGVLEEDLPPRFNFYSDEELLRLLRTGLDSSEGRLTLDGWDSVKPRNWPTSGTYLRRFGSWAHAVRLARSIVAIDAGPTVVPSFRDQ